MTQTVGGQDASQIASAAAGDETAFRRLISAHHEDMRRVCAYIAGDLTIAEDATVAANEAKQLIRKRRTRARFEITTDASEEPGGRDPATGVSGMDLRDAISRLRPDDRALLALRYVAGFDSNDLAIATGRKPAAIRQHLKRLRDRLREDLTDD
jgi:DNA-directed RNA polymerase specialized sigma24 family protein